MSELSLPTFRVEYGNYNFASEKEEQHAAKLTHLQKHHIENLMRVYMNEKLSMHPEVENYLGKQQYCLGCINTLQYILALSDAADQKLTEQE